MGWMASAAVAASSVAASPVYGQFFFLIPLPKGSANPDAIDANLNQRQNAMCATYHERAIDPTLSGKRENTWRGEVSRLAADRMKDFPAFKDLKNRYARQWQLQAKNSYQAGVEYSRNLLTACNEVDLPYDKGQYENWKKILNFYPNSQSVFKMVRPAAAVATENWLNGIEWGSVRPLTTVRSTIVEVLVQTSGKPGSCEIKVSSGTPELDALACEAVNKNGQFIPPIEGFSIRSDYIDYNFNWPAVFQARLAAQAKGAATEAQASKPPSQPADRNTGSRDPDLETAVNRCTTIGFAPGSEKFKQCVSEQLRLLAR